MPKKPSLLRWYRTYHPVLRRSHISNWVLSCIAIALATASPARAMAVFDEYALLARAHFNIKNITSDEVKLIKSVRYGYYNGGQYVPPRSGDPMASPMFVKAKIRIGVLDWLLSDPKALAYLRLSGLQLNDVDFTGGLNLDSLTIPHPIIFNDCNIQYLSISGCHFNALSFIGSQVSYLDIRYTTIDESLELSDNFVSESGVYLYEVQIGHDLNCHGGIFHKGGLQCTGLRVEKDLHFEAPFQSEGPVSLQGAQIGGNLYADGGHFKSDVMALILDDSKIAENVSMRNGFAAGGLVSFVDARVGGAFLIGNAKFTGKELSLNCYRAIIDKEVEIRDNTVFEGSVSFNGADVQGDCSLRDTKLSFNKRCFDATGAIIAGNFWMSDGVSANGEVCLSRAKITLDAIFSNFSSQAEASSMDLSWIYTGQSIFMDEHFSAAGSINLYGASISADLDCRGGHFNALKSSLSANNSKISGNVWLTNNDDDIAQPFLGKGLVSFYAAQIGGDLSCRDAKLNGIDASFDCTNAKIGGSVFFNNHFSALGTVTLYAANIEKDLICTGGEFRCVKTAIEATLTKVGKDVLMDNQFVALGNVSARGLTVGNDLACSGGQFLGAPKSFELQNAKIGGSAYLNKTIEDPENLKAFKAAGFVSLEGSKIGGELTFYGGTFESLDVSSSTIGNDFYLDTHFTASGLVDIDGTAIGGSLFCSGATFGGSPVSLDASKTKVAGNVHFSVKKEDDGSRIRFQAKGLLNLNDAKIDGGLFCQGSELLSKDSSIDFSSASIAKNVRFDDDFIAAGKVEMADVQISGDLIVAHCTLNAPLTAFDASRARIGGDLYVGAAPDTPVLSSGFLAASKVLLTNAKVEGQVYFGQVELRDVNIALDCTGLEVGHEIHVDGPLTAVGSLVINDVTCSRNFIFENVQLLGALNALSLSRATLGGDLDFGKRFSAVGRVDLSNTTVAGELDLSGAQLSCSGIALEATGIRVGKNLYLRKDFNAKGAVILTRASVDGNIDCTGGRFFGRKGYPALSLSRATVLEDVLLQNQFEADGPVDLSYATISKRLVHRNALEPEKSFLNFNSAHVTAFFEDANSWPAAKHLTIDNFEYDSLKYDADYLGSELAWLKLQPDNIFLPQPYEHLADTLRKMGWPEDATKVTIAKNQVHAGYVDFPGTSWLWYNGIGKAIGFGYDPFPAICFGIAMIILGAGLAKFGHYKRVMLKRSDFRTQNEDRPATPRFNSLIYSLESFVPLVNLGMRDTWIFDAGSGDAKKVSSKMKLGGVLRYYFWIHTLSGWAVSTLMLGWFTGLVKT
jgi:hypothetical protein